MKIQIIVASLNADTANLAARMNVEFDTIICNQCSIDSAETYQYNGHEIKVLNYSHTGVGKNRNQGIMASDADWILFADDDIVYDTGFGEKVIKAIEENPKADALMFNVSAAADMAVYNNEGIKRIRWYNYGRYPMYAMCVKRFKLLGRPVLLSTEFGGGAEFSNGEDSIFIHDCLKEGMRIYSVPVHIGKEVPRDEGSTWFKGCDEKFFYDRGVLYSVLYPKIMQKPLLRRYFRSKKNTLFKDGDRQMAVKQMISGRAYGTANFSR